MWKRKLCFLILALVLMIDSLVLFHRNTAEETGSYLLPATDAEEVAALSQTSAMSETTWQPAVLSIKDAVHERVSVKRREISEIHTGDTDPSVAINNNRIQGNFIFPNQDGFLYACTNKEGDGPSAAFVYDDGKGKRTVQPDLPEFLLYVGEDAVYYPEEDGLKRRTGKPRTDRNLEKTDVSNADDEIGSVQEIIPFTEDRFYSFYFAGDYIYYSEADEAQKKTYLSKVGYDGKQNTLLYECDVEITQIYFYGTELWFLFSEFQEDAPVTLAKLRIPENELVVYPEIEISGVGSTGSSQIVVNHGWVYYNSNGFWRLRISDQATEKIYPKDVDGVNFIQEGILFFRKNRLYRMDAEGIHLILKCKGSTAGFDGIRVEGDQIYVSSYAGAFYNRIWQIDRAGKAIRMIWDE